jgi:hypothetical protein
MPDVAQRKSKIVKMACLGFIATPFFNFFILLMNKSKGDSFFTRAKLNKTIFKRTYLMM